jgi:SulP family sulfate permease
VIGAGAGSAREGEFVTATTAPASDTDDASTSVLSSLLAGAVSGVLAVTFMYSYAAVIMAAADPTLTPRLTGHFLLGGAVIAITVALTSQFRSVVALPQDTPTAVLAVVVASTVAEASTATSAEELFATVLALIVVSTLLIGVVFWLVGQYRMAALGQYVPYPVVAGFLASTGWLLVKGSFAVMAGTGFDFGDLTNWWDVRRLWIPGVLLAVLVLFLKLRYRNPFILPVLVVASTLGYHVVRVASGQSRSEATAEGWLLEPLPNEPLVQAVSPGDVEWSALTDQAFGIVTIAIVALIGVLLNLTAIGSALDTDVDVDREMRIVGMSNVAAAATGSIVGFHYVSLTTLGRSMRGNSRIVGVVVGLFCLAAALVAAGGLSYIPQFVLGGMVLYVGMDLLYNWLILSAKRLPWVEWAIVVAIIAVVELVGFLEGVAAGLLATIVHFVITYSRTGAIRHVFTGQEIHSSVERSTAERLALEPLEQGILLIKLHGYIFFASTVGLVDSTKERLSEADAAVTHLILDFEHVTGVDASGFNGFDKLVRIAAAQSVVVAYTSLSPRIANEFERIAVERGGKRDVVRLESSDEALEAFEDELLRKAGLDPGLHEYSFDYTLREMFHNAAQIAIFREALDPIDVDAGTVLPPSDDSAGHLDFVESGTLVVISPHDERTRIRRAGPGSILGIASFFKHGGPSSLVKIRAESVCRIHRLDTDSYFDLVSNNPQVAAALQRYALVAVSDRYANLITAFELVMREKA